MSLKTYAEAAREAIGAELQAAGVVSSNNAAMPMAH